MSYRIEDFTMQNGQGNYAFGVCPQKTAQALRRLAIGLVDESGPKVLINRVTVVHKVTANDFAATTIILHVFEPKDMP